MKQPPIKTKELSGSTVQIADGQNWEIASITAYGENAHGGTTEAPVALTGISSVTVNDDVTELPIPRPLRKVGDVRDVCRTRVKSVYDKRIVIDQNSDIFPSGDVSVVGTSRRFNIELPDLPATPYDVLGAVACDKLPRRTAGGSSGGTYGRDELGISVQNDSNSHSINFRVPGCKTLEEIKSWLTDNPLTVYYQSTSYNGANGLDVCLTEYQTGFVELDGTEKWVQGTGSNAGYLEAQVLKNTNESHLAVSSIAPFKYQFSGNCVFVTNNKVTFGSAPGSAYTVDTWKAYLAAQKAAGTPVQVAYHLATPEVYATEPLDFDNAAGPLTVMTGGEVEVRMTELVGSRTYDADGDGVVDKAAAVPWDGVTGKPGTFAPSAHTHDDRYYTETEMNTKLNGKADSGHTHTSIRMYNSDWSGTDGSITPVYANANKDYVNLSAGNDAGNKWPHVSCQRINGHALNMSLSGTTLSITW